MSMEQMTIFDTFEEQDKEQGEPTFTVGDKVKVEDYKKLSGLSIEDEVILSQYSGKKGIVVNIHYGKVTTYEVEFNAGERSYFYARELIYLG